MGTELDRYVTLAEGDIERATVIRGLGEDPEERRRAEDWRRSLSVGLHDGLVDFAIPLGGHIQTRMDRARRRNRTRRRQQDRPLRQRPTLCPANRRDLAA